MKKIVKTVLVMAGLAIVQPGWALSPQTLIKGQSTTLTVDYDIGEVAVTDPAVCDYMVQESRREIYLNPKKEGRTSLTLWDTTGAKHDTVPLTVISVGLREILEDAKATFEGSGTLKFFIQGEQVVIRGEAASPADVARINAFAAQFPQVRNEARLAAAVLETISSEIEKAIATPGIRVRSIRDKLVIEGTAYSTEAASRAEKIAKLYDENVLNLIAVKDTKRNPGAEKLIQLDIHFMEIKKSALRSFGINWAPGSTSSGGGGSNASAGGSASAAGADAMGLSGLANSVVGFVFNLAPKIKFTRQKGDGRVLENPSFMVKSGETADFFSGTQVPFYSQQAVVFKDIGVKVQAEPIASAEDVDLKINVTMTSPTAGGVNKGIDTNTVSTTAYCKAGSSLALAGIFRNQDAKTYNKIPEDSNTSSALFTLFLSKDFVSNRSEFVIFVTPRIIDSASGQANVTTMELSDWDKMNENIIKKRSRKEYREYTKNKYGGGVVEKQTRSKSDYKGGKGRKAGKGVKVVEEIKEERTRPVEERAVKEEPAFELPESLR
jgi:pilus assembly protein CpaC